MGGKAISLQHETLIWDGSNQIKLGVVKLKSIDPDSTYIFYPEESAVLHYAELQEIAIYLKEVNKK